MASAACANNLPISPDFEFRLQDPVNILPADQLFSNGKLLPLHLHPISSPKTTSITISDPVLFSPKAPRCSTRWKNLLSLKKLYPSTTTNKSTPSNKSIKHLLHRNGKSSPENGSINLPLLKDSDNESLSISSRPSLSSSSSSHDHDDLPRLSLDSEKPNPISINRNPNPRTRLVKSRAGSFDGNKPDPNNRVGRSSNPTQMELSATQGCRGVSVDSPRLNSSGKIVFQGLERSSSSPGSFTGGPRFRMDRSYSANVRVTPVLNVPVCSLRSGSKSGSVFGFGQLFSGSASIGGGNSNKNHQHNSDKHQQHKHP